MTEEKRGRGKADRRTPRLKCRQDAEVPSVRSQTAPYWQTKDNGRRRRRVCGRNERGEGGWRVGKVERVEENGRRLTKGRKKVGEKRDEAP